MTFLLFISVSASNKKKINNKKPLKPIKALIALRYALEIFFCCFKFPPAVVNQNLGIFSQKINWLLISYHPLHPPTKVKFEMKKRKDKNQTKTKPKEEKIVCGEATIACDAIMPVLLQVNEVWYCTLWWRHVVTTLTLAVVW